MRYLKGENMAETEQKPIEIIIKNSTSEQAAEQNPATKDPTDDAKKGVKQGLQWDLKASSINMALKNQAMQFMSAAASQYGNITGDYSTAKNISALTQIVGYATDLAMGPIGWISLTGKLATQGLMHVIQMQKESYEIDRTRDRYGAIYTQGGRGTSE
jgi:hypothetical protein